MPLQCSAGTVKRYWAPLPRNSSFLRCTGQRMKQEMRCVLAGGEARILNRRIEVNALTRAGKELPIELGLAHPTAAGVVFGAILRDISQRARENALRVSEQTPAPRHRKMSAKASRWCKMGASCFANPRTLELVDRSLEELRAKPFTEAIHPSDRALVK